MIHPDTPPDTPPHTQSETQSDMLSDTPSHTPSDMLSDTPFDISLEIYTITDIHPVNILSSHHIINRPSLVYILQSTGSKTIVRSPTSASPPVAIAIDSRGLPINATPTQPYNSREALPSPPLNTLTRDSGGNQQQPKTIIY